MRSSWRHVGWLLVSASAFAVGFYVKRPTPEVIEAPVAIAKDMPKAEAPTPKAAPKVVKNDLHDLIIPDGPGTPPEQIPIPKNDPSIAEIRKQMGHNTGSLLSDTRPPEIPVILTSDRKEASEPPLLVPPRPAPQPVLHPIPNQADILTLPSPQPDVPVIELPRTKKGPAEATKPLLLKNRAVQLHYDITNVGSGGIKYIEVWAREQKTHSAPWVKLERFAGTPKQLATTLPGEGVYGLLVVLESESGRRSRVPTLDTTSDLLVEVDLTPPQLSVPEVQATGADRIVEVRWAMADKNLDAAKTRVEYSVDGQTWQTAEQDAIPRATPFDVSVPLGPHCRMRWVVPPHVGSQVQLRVTAADHAGNTAIAATPTKVNIDLVTPAGRLTKITPSNCEPERGPMPREVVR